MHRDLEFPNPIAIIIIITTPQNSISSQGSNFLVTVSHI